MNYPKQGKVIYLEKGSRALDVRVQRASKKIPKNLLKTYTKFFEWIEKEEPAAIDFMERAYAIVEQAREVQAEHVVCQKGCNACCYLAVDVSAIEVSYIQHVTGIKPLHANMVSRSVNTVEENHGKKCPFLDSDNGGGCKIYHARPLVCRVFSALDHPKYCSVDSRESHNITTAYAGGFTSNLQRAFSNISIDNFGIDTADIRDWFQDIR